MHTHGIDVFHVTYSDTVACAVAHHLILDLLPACNTALHKNLSHTGKAKTVFQNGFQLHLIVGDTAAGTSQCISGTKHHRITDGIGKRDTVLNAFHHLGSRTGLTDLFHGVLKFLTVLSLFDGSCRCSQKLYIVGSKEAAFLKLHTQVKTGLASQRRKDTVRLFLFNDLLKDLCRKRLDINLICNIFICHNGGGIGVYQNNLNALLL